MTQSIAYSTPTASLPSASLDPAVIAASIERIRSAGFPGAQPAPSSSPSSSFFESVNAGAAQPGTSPAPTAGDAIADPDAPGRGDGLIPAPPGDGKLKLGPMQFNIYGMALSAAGIAGYGVFNHVLTKSGNVAAKAALPKIVVPAVIAGLVGARLYHVATQWDYYKDHKDEIPKMWEGGMAIYGGVAAGALVGSLMARRAGIHVSPLLDAAAIALPIAQALGRSGNYANQELFGRPTDLPWGLQVDPEFRPEEYKDRNSFHPTFAYEAAWNVALAGGLYGLSKVWTSRPPGVLFATYVAGYAAGRFLVEGLRTDPSKEAGGLRTNQWTSLAMIGAAGVGAAVLMSRGRIHP